VIAPRWTGRVTAARFGHQGRLLATGASDARNDTIIWDVTYPDPANRLIDRRGGLPILY
jgi:hypothetical protein